MSAHRIQKNNHTKNCKTTTKQNVFYSRTKFTKITYKISNRKIGTILDDVGAKPFYNKEINQWMYPGVMELHTAQELSLKITLGNIMKWRVESN